MQHLSQILSRSFLHNTLFNYTISFGIFLLLCIIAMLIRFVFLSKVKERAEETETDLDDFAILQFKKNIMPVLYFSTLYIATRNLVLHARIEKGLDILGILLISFFGVRLLSATIQKLMEKYLKRIQSDDEYIHTMRGLFPIINIIIWSIGTIFLLDNLGFNISAVVAGLGIGGIAVALAAQAVLGDLFSYFAILIDKPFEVGDAITVGGMTGKIEKIGLKTTRIRSNGGEQLIFSNSDLTGSRVQNLKRMNERRVVFHIDVTFATAEEKLNAIPGMIQKTIEGIPATRFDRAHFAEIKDASFSFEIVYFVLTDDYNTYMDIQQEINLAVCAYFRKKRISFAYPTQTVYVTK